MSEKAPSSEKSVEAASGGQIPEDMDVETHPEAQAPGPSSGASGRVPTTASGSIPKSIGRSFHLC